MDYSKKNRKKFSRNRRSKTLKHRIHNYVSKKQDICCEEDVDRKLIIEQIVENYKKISKDMNEPDEYLNYIDNDLVKLIGYKVDLEKNGDHEGVALWNEMDKRININKKVNIKKVEKLLHEVPLYFLLSFFGYSCYREKQSVPI